MMDDRVLFTKIDCQEHERACAKAAITAYPTIKLYAPGSHRKADGGIRLSAQPAARFVDVIRRVLGERGFSTTPYAAEQHDEL